MSSDFELTRRRMVRLAAGTCVVMVGRAEAAGSSERPDGDDEQEVSPVEDLMREHGLLNRVLLVYDESIRRIDAGLELPPEPVRKAADIIRTFIEDYHEKLEEDHVFPRFEKAGRLSNLTTVLRRQHLAGRQATDEIVSLATLERLGQPEAAARVRDLLRQFVSMYRPHEAREDTVLFPALREVEGSGRGTN